ncbi:MAG: phosphoglycerate kinase, partial [Candidatus Omnitrophota bacterium]
LGGAKVSDKIALIENLLPKADAFIIGGGMVYTFLKALGKNIGDSLLEEDKIPTAKAVLDKAKARGVEMALSSDFVIVEDFNKPESRKTVSGEIPDGWQGVDIGPESRRKFKDVLSKAKTIVWNGPLGVFEIDAYAEGTKDIAEYIAGRKGVTSIIGGGDSAAAVAKFNVEAGMTHISTGGGASLEFLEGKELPGVAALNNA